MRDLCCFLIAAAVRGTLIVYDIRTGTFPVGHAQKAAKGE